VIEQNVSAALPSPITWRSWKRARVALVGTPAQLRTDTRAAVAPTSVSQGRRRPRPVRGSGGRDASRLRTHRSSASRTQAGACQAVQFRVFGRPLPSNADRHLPISYGRPAPSYRFTPVTTMFPPEIRLGITSWPDTPSQSTSAVVMETVGLVAAGGAGAWVLRCLRRLRSSASQGAHGARARPSPAAPRLRTDARMPTSLPRRQSSHHASGVSVAMGLLHDPPDVPGFEIGHQTRSRASVPNAHLGSKSGPNAHWHNGSAACDAYVSYRET